MREAEQALLGAMMLSQTAAEGVPAIVTAEDFTYESHREVFRAIATLTEDGVKADQVALSDVFTDKSYLLDIVSATPIATNWKQYARIVADNAEAKRIVSLGERMAQGMTAIDAEQALRDASRKTITHTDLKDIIEARIPTLSEPREYVWMDEFPGVHLHYGDLFLIAARPAVGKSALGLQLAEEWATRNLKVRFYNLEMSDEDMADRIIQRHTTYDGNALDRGEADPNYVGEAMRHIPNIDIVDAASMQLGAVIADARRFARSRGRIIIIDYLQLLVEQTYEQVTEASRRLKLLARSTGLLVVSLSQLSRKSVSAEGTLRPPTMADLRQSGALEQDADDIMLLHAYAADDEAIRDKLITWRYILDPQCVDKTLGHAELAKLRRGTPRRVPCYFDGDDLTWTSIDKEAP